MENLKQYLKGILSIHPGFDNSFDNNEKLKREDILFSVQLEKFNKKYSQILGALSELNYGNKKITDEKVIKTTYLTLLRILSGELNNLIDESFFNLNLKKSLKIIESDFIKQTNIIIQNDKGNYFNESDKLVSIIESLTKLKKNLDTQIKISDLGPVKV